MSSPFLLMMSIALINLFGSLRMQSAVVNRLSGLSLLVLALHHDPLFKIFVRPAIWARLYAGFGFDHIILLVCGYAAALFLSSLLLAMLYKAILQKFVYRAADRLSAFFVRASDALVSRLMRLR